MMSTRQTQIRLLMLVGALMLATACSEPTEKDSQLAVAKVELGPLTILVRAEGELAAENSVPLTLPPGNVMPRTIVWLADDGQWVEAGDVVARFDQTMAERSLDRMLTELKKSDLDIEAKNREFRLALNRIAADLTVTKEELGIAERFSVEDGSIAMSRQDMIERLQDEGFLRIKRDHFQQRYSGQSGQREAELAVLEAQRQGESGKLDIYQQQIDASVALAPNAGYLVIHRSWYGQPLSAGQSVFPGNAFAEIPDLEEMQAVLQVLESEAGNIAVGQTVKVWIDAFPDRPLTGTVSSMAQVPASLERDSPIKYFAVDVSLEQSDSSWITAGARVRAEIEVLRKDQTLTIANQAIERSLNGDDQRVWVHIKNGSKIEKRYVELGERGPVRTEIIAGLEAGDEVLLVRPEVDLNGANK